MAHDVFISHSPSNRPVANAVCAALEGAGIRSWIAPRDVMPGQSYPGEITRAIQQSRAFILIFSQHSNNSEQVLREVQQAANSRLPIVQFRIDAVAPSADLEYYLSGQQSLDAVTPPLENHLGELKDSVQTLLAMPRVDVTELEPPRTPGASPRPADPTPNIRKWATLGIAALAALGCVALVIIPLLLRPHPATISPDPHAMPSPVRQSSPVILPPATTAPNDLSRMSIAPPSNSPVLTTEEAELFVKEFSRDMEHGDLEATARSLDETVDYYASGPKPKAFVVDQLRQYFTAAPFRTFRVGDVKVQPGPKPTVATVIFDTRYSVRDASGNPGNGRIHSEWDVVRRNDGLKIIRGNWMTYPDAPASR